MISSRTVPREALVAMVPIVDMVNHEDNPNYGPSVPVPPPSVGYLWDRVRVHSRFFAFLWPRRP